MNNEMTLTQALQILSDATEPQAAGRISRQGYLSIQKALETLAALLPKEEALTKTHPSDGGTALL
jgi:hypothetical protein